MDPQLLEILACPDTHHAPLTHDPAGEVMACTECGRRFPIIDGIPVLLLDEAETPGQSEPTAAADSAASADAPAPADQVDAEPAGGFKSAIPTDGVDRP